MTDQTSMRPIRMNGHNKGLVKKLAFLNMLSVAMETGWQQKNLIQH